MSKRESVKKLDGWGHEEFDEFEVPFRWIGRSAELLIANRPECSNLCIQAGSPDFEGARTLIVESDDMAMEARINPGWQGYQFDLSGIFANAAGDVRLRLRVDPLLAIPEDSRDLGLMIRDVQLRPSVLSDTELKMLDWDRRIARRVAYYQRLDAPRVIWLASYPRSGNTWLRFLLTNLLFEPVERSSMVGDYIDEILDPLYAARDGDERTLRAFGGQAAHLMKTHLPYTPSMPLAGETHGAIYIVRNPLDMAVSIDRRFRQVHEQGVADTFLTYGVYPETLLRGFGSWHAHVYSWSTLAAESAVPVLLLRYEDMVTDTAAVCRRVLDWLQIDRAPEDIERAVQASSLESLKAMEQQEVSQRMPGIFFDLESEKLTRDLRFLGDGRSNEYDRYLTEEQIAVGRATFGPLLRKLGYS